MSPRQVLHQSLERLRAELAASASLSPAERVRLEGLLREALARAEGEDGADEEPQSLADRLQEATEHFQESHPNLTQAIGAVAEALSHLGI